MYEPTQCPANSNRIRRDIKITTPEKENKRLWKKKKTEKKINRRGVSPEKPEIKSNPPRARFVRGGIFHLISAAFQHGAEKFISHQHRPALQLKRHPIHNHGIRVIFQIPIQFFVFGFNIIPKLLLPLFAA